MTIGQEGWGGFLKMPSEVSGRAAGVRTGRFEGREVTRFKLKEPLERAQPSSKFWMSVTFHGVQPKAVNLDKSRNKQYKIVGAESCFS